MIFTFDSIRRNNATIVHERELAVGAGWVAQQEAFAAQLEVDAHAAELADSALRRNSNSCQSSKREALVKTQPTLPPWKEAQLSLLDLRPQRHLPCRRSSR